MRISKNETIYLSATFIALAAFVGIVNFSLQGTAAQELTSIEYSPSVPENHIVMKQGESKVIPVGLVYPQEKSLRLKVGVTVPHNESFYIATGIDNLPTGISTSFSKKTIELQATQLKGFAERDSNDLTLTASNIAKLGNYQLSVVYYEDDGRASFRYITLEIQK